MDNNANHYIVILNDGETYSALPGCRIVGVINIDADELDDHIKDYYEYGVEISELLDTE